MQEMLKTTPAESANAIRNGENIIGNDTTATADVAKTYSKLSQDTPHGAMGNLQLHSRATEQIISPMTSHPENKRHNQPGDEALLNGSPSKRQRVEHSAAQKTKEEALSDEMVIFGGVAKMLDPISLCHCPSVSKFWKELPVFQDEDTWLNLAAKRFGYYNVRQWSEKYEDGESGGKKISNKMLYKQMNAANVMPHFSQEGVSLLGDARIPGRVSGWVFIVERSNGETLRSVKREPGTTLPGNGSYQSRPVVELRIVVQNTGMANQPVVLKDQLVPVDVSTRRSGGELQEISWDDRFKKVVRNLDGTIRKVPSVSSNRDLNAELCRLNLFETAVFEVHINARGCSTTSKFQQRSNFTKLLVSLDGTTVPMVIPFLRDHSVH